MVECFGLGRGKGGGTCILARWHWGSHAIPVRNMSSAYLFLTEHSYFCTDAFICWLLFAVRIPSVCASGPQLGGMA